MNRIPKAAEPLIREFAEAFTRPTSRRFVVLLLAALMTTGRRTVTNLLRTVSVSAPGTHRSSPINGAAFHVGPRASQSASGGRSEADAG